LLKNAVLTFVYMQVVSIRSCPSKCWITCKETPSS
jgi:hypothetical protein